MKRIRRNLTYANVMSSLAFFFAFAGGAAYAANEWTGANIVDGSLTGADVKNETLTYNDVALGTLGGGRVADNSLTGADILESSLGKVKDADTLDGKDSTQLADAVARGFTTRFGDGGGAASGSGSGSSCTISEIRLIANDHALPGGVIPAHGQTLPISENETLFQLIGTTYGGDGEETFKVPDMRPIEPDHMTYGICLFGAFPTAN